MSLIDRVKRLWELSGSFSDAEDVKLADKLMSRSKRLKKQRLATIIEDDPEEFFSIAENEDDNTSKQTSAD